jgi:hypothetical protein
MDEMFAMICSNKQTKILEPECTSYYGRMLLLMGKEDREGW